MQPHHYGMGRVHLQRLLGQFSRGPLPSRPLVDQQHHPPHGAGLVPHDDGRVHAEPVGDLGRSQPVRQGFRLQPGAQLARLDVREAGGGGVDVFLLRLCGGVFLGIVGQVDLALFGGDQLAALEHSQVGHDEIVHCGVDKEDLAVGLEKDFEVGRVESGLSVGRDEVINFFLVGGAASHVLLEARGLSVLALGRIEVQQLGQSVLTGIVSADSFFQKLSELRKELGLVFFGILAGHLG
mmetsp:Transcript_6152/g.13297  ORF Transcript_6152/g.13297 Transcript_6152/m.13297 type:complete len:238 (-) Transcript_6152:713-1426(-)